MEKIFKTFRTNLKFYRISKGWTKTELAVQSNIPEIQIGKIESGKQKPSFDKIVALSNALGITPADLFLRNSSKVSFADFEQLSAQQSKAIVQLIKSLAKANKKNAMENSH